MKGGGENVFKQSMIPKYPRYWHGYLIFLRPLMCFFVYTDIRYIYMLLHLLLFSSVLVELSRRTKAFYSLAFAFSMGVVYFPLLPYNMNCSTVFFIMYVFCIWLLRKHDAGNAVTNLALIFWAIGMITNFFDLLTAPLITLGVPLIILFLIEESCALKQNICRGICLAIAWGGGYATSWAAKWTLGTVILQQNVWADAIQQSLLRIGAEDDTSFLSYRIDCVKKNFFFLIPECATYGLVKCVVLLFAIIYLFICLKHHKAWNEIRRCMVFPLIAVAPYLWFFVFANHSEIHAFFTYRIQMITVLSMLIWAYQIIDWGRVSIRLRFPIVHRV